MEAALKAGERIEIRGFGSFEIRHYKAYEGRNPRTGAKVDVKPKRLPFFKVGKELKERVNEGRLTNPTLPDDDDDDAEDEALESRELSSSVSPTMTGTNPGSGSNDPPRSF